MLEAGATVAITGRSQGAVEGALTSLQPKGRVSGFVVDVRNEEQVYKLVEDVIAEFGRIDIWVNNAGYSNAAGMMLDMNPQDALDMFMSNDLGVLQCTQAIMRYMHQHSLLARQHVTHDRLRALQHAKIVRHEHVQSILRIHIQHHARRIRIARVIDPDINATKFLR